MISCTRRLEFDAAHRLLGHESKCINVHGHRYAVEITCWAEELDGVGRVVDFSVIKKAVGGWIDRDLDHVYISHQHDPIHTLLLKAGLQVYLMPLGEEPTAENMARMIAKKAQELLAPWKLLVDRVRLYETPNCWADWSASDE